MAQGSPLVGTVRMEPGTEIGIGTGQRGVGVTAGAEAGAVIASRHRLIGAWMETGTETGTGTGAGTGAGTETGLVLAAVEVVAGAGAGVRLGVIVTIIIVTMIMMIVMMDMEEDVVIGVMPVTLVPVPLGPLLWSGVEVLPLWAVVCWQTPAPSVAGKGKQAWGQGPPVQEVSLVQQGLLRLSNPSPPPLCVGSEGWPPIVAPWALFYGTTFAPTLAWTLKRWRWRRRSCDSWTLDSRALRVS